MTPADRAAYLAENVAFMRQLGRVSLTWRQRAVMVEDRPAPSFAGYAEHADIHDPDNHLSQRLEIPSGVAYIGSDREDPCDPGVWVVDVHDDNGSCYDQLWATLEQHRPPTAIEIDLMARSARLFDKEI
jgi:hypothetical protein